MVPIAQADDSHPQTSSFQAFEVPHLSLVQVSGSDAIKVLNGLCTAKLAELKAGDATEAMFTDDRGRVLAHGMIALEADQAATWFVGQAFDASQLVGHIDRFIFREQAEPKNVSGSWQGWLIDLPMETNDWHVLAAKVGLPTTIGCGGLEILGHKCRLIRLPMTSQQSRIMLVPQAMHAELPGWFKDMGISVGSTDELEDRRIRNFWPKATHEINERTLPQELDRDQLAVSFTKGCYLGQETVARLDAMGEVQKKLCLVELHGSTEMIRPGDALVRDGKEVGKLNSVSPIERLGKRLALATMRRVSMSPGSTFQTAVAEGAATPMVSGVVIPHT